MSTLYIRLPSKAAADSAAHWLALACPFAVVSQGNLSPGSEIERHGTATLPELSRTVAKVQRVVLLLAAADVTLRQMQIPPLSAARLKAALPNLMEDQLIGDAAECVMIAGRMPNTSGNAGGLHIVAAVQRSWLAILAKTLIAYGARQIIALPGQLCLALPAGQSNSAAAAVNEWEGDIDLTMRLSEQDGFGVAVTAKDNSATTVIETLATMLPHASITLYVPQPALRGYQEAINPAAPPDQPLKHINVLADSWSHWDASGQVTSLNLMTALGAAAANRLDWRPWSWPVILAAAVLILNAAALNIDWWRMKNEANSLRMTLVQIYRTTYPKETVIIDPVAQMQQKIAAAKRNSGLANADDFTALIAVFGEAWATVAGTGKSSAIAAIEYRDRSLYVRLKPGNEIPAAPLKTALAQHNLALDPVPEQAGVWQVRSMK